MKLRLSLEVEPTDNREKARAYRLAKLFEYLFETEDRLEKETEERDNDKDNTK